LSDGVGALRECLSDRVGGKEDARLERVQNEGARLGRGR